MKIRFDLRRSMSLVMIIIIVIFCLTFYLNLVALKVTTSTSNRGFFQEFFNVDKHVFKTCLVDEHCDGGFSCKNESCVKMLFIEACNCTIDSRPLSLINVNNDEKMDSQMWFRGKTDAHGWFTIRHYESGLFMTKKEDGDIAIEGIFLLYSVLSKNTGAYQN